MNEFRFVNLLGATQKPRRQMLNGREHLVVPVVALVEGVVRAMNSKQHELVRAEKFSTAPSVWNGKPIMAGHPVENGVPISANDPRVLERSFGQVFETKVDGKRLLMEAWIDIEKAKSMPDANKVLERCLAHERGDAGAKPIEVSTGSFVGVKKVEGDYNGKRYQGEWDVIGPDHLAMLAEDKVGACSVAMGCGALRAMQLGEDGELRCLEGDEILEVLGDKPGHEFHGNQHTGPNAIPSGGHAPGDEVKVRGNGKPENVMKSIHRLFRGAEGRIRSFFRLAQDADEMSDRDLKAKLSAKLREAEGDPYVDVEAFWPVDDPERVVYMCRRPRRKLPNEPIDAAYAQYEYVTYERGFTLDRDGSVTLGTTRIEVAPTMRWEPTDDAEPEDDALRARYMAAQLYDLAGRRHSAADEEMIQKVHDHAVGLGASCAEPRHAEAHECACRKNKPQGEENMDRTKTIAALAAHPHSAIKDPKLLEKMDDAMLTALEAGAAATEASIKVAKDAQATAEVALTAAQAAATGEIPEDRLPEAYRTLMAEHRAKDAAEQAGLVTTLKAAQSAYTEDELKAMALPELRKLSAALKVAAPAPQFPRAVPRMAESGGRSFAPPDAYAAGLAAAKK